MCQSFDFQVEHLAIPIQSHVWTSFSADRVLRLKFYHQHLKNPELFASGILIRPGYYNLWFGLPQHRGVTLKVYDPPSRSLLGTEEIMCYHHLLEATTAMIIFLVHIRKIWTLCQPARYLKLT
jgi:hypothetical protein